MADTVNEAFKVTLQDGRYTVIEARLEFGSPLVATDQVELRFHYENGTAFDSYGSSTRMLTLEAPPSALMIQGGAFSGRRMN